MQDPNRAIQALQSVLSNKLMPGGDGSVPVLQSAIQSLSHGDRVNAIQALKNFQLGARHTPDFMAKGYGGTPYPDGSGDDVWTKLIQGI